MRRRPTAPYVFRDGADAWKAVSVQSDGGENQKDIASLARGASITVDAVGAVPAFKVKLRAPAQPPPDEIRVPKSAPLFVVADTHGEYEILVSMLQKHGVVNQKLAWKFGRGHLVLLGDVFDRGPNQTEILWLVYQLEAEARRAGGGVHLVLGNHETMVLMGDLRYLNPKYVQTTATVGLRIVFAVVRRHERARAVAAHAAHRAQDQRSAVPARRAFTGARRQPDVAGRHQRAACASLLEGAMPENDAQRDRLSLLMGSSGPLWYRGYFAEQTTFPTASSEDVDARARSIRRPQDSHRPYHRAGGDAVVRRQGHRRAGVSAAQ